MSRQMSSRLENARHRAPESAPGRDSLKTTAATGPEPKTIIFCFRGPARVNRVSENDPFLIQSSMLDDQSSAPNCSQITRAGEMQRPEMRQTEPGKDQSSARPCSLVSSMLDSTPRGSDLIQTHKRDRADQDQEDPRHARRSSLSSMLEDPRTAPGGCGIPGCPVCAPRARQDEPGASERAETGRDDQSAKDANYSLLKTRCQDLRQALETLRDSLTRREPGERQERPERARQTQPNPAELYPPAFNASRPLLAVRKWPFFVPVNGGRARQKLSTANDNQHYVTRIDALYCVVCEKTNIMHLFAVDSVDNLTGELDRSRAAAGGSRFWRAHCRPPARRGVCSIANVPVSRFQGPACWTGAAWPILVQTASALLPVLGPHFSRSQDCRDPKIFPVHFWTFTGQSRAVRGLGGRAGARSHCMTPVLADVFTGNPVRQSQEAVSC